MFWCSQSFSLRSGENWISVKKCDHMRLYARNECSVYSPSFFFLLHLNRKLKMIHQLKSIEYYLHFGWELSVKCQKQLDQLWFIHLFNSQTKWNRVLESVWCAFVNRIYTISDTRYATLYWRCEMMKMKRCFQFHFKAGKYRIFVFVEY